MLLIFYQSFHFFYLSFVLVFESSNFGQHFLDFVEALELHVDVRATLSVSSDRDVLTLALRRVFVVLGCVQGVHWATFENLMFTAHWVAGVLEALLPEVNGFI